METPEPTIPEKTTKPPARLPTEIVLLILIHLDHHTLLAATASCRQWYFLAKEYRQYLWRHLALRDFAFTAARGLWKLDFLKDKDLRTCFPQRPVVRRPLHQQPSLTSSKGHRHHLHPVSASPLSSSLSSKSYLNSPLYRSGGSNTTASDLAPICTSCWASLQKETEKPGMQSISKEHNTRFVATNAERMSSTPWTGLTKRASGGGELTEGAQERQQHNNSFTNSNRTSISMLSFDNCASCLQSLDRKGKRRAEHELSSSQGYEMDDIQYKDDNSQEHDWKALYQMTSNWYLGRAKGYCPLMLPSLTTLASATRALSDRSGLGLGLDSGSNLGTRAGTGGVDTIQPSPCTPAQIAIQRLLKKRKPVAVIGLQHEGSSLTAVSLAKILVEHGMSEQGAGSSRVQLLRSNPHYREKRIPPPPSPHQSNTSTGLASTTDVRPPNPNIMMQDPRKHENVSFAIRTASPPPTTTADYSGTDEPGVSAGLNPESQLTQQPIAAITPSPTTGQPTLNEIANDILCHYSSPLHSFLVTGHMDGIVRLWDLSILEPGQQCIRYWQTGPRRRVLCVGMNSKVVVCGNVDSTICVWDIHPSPGSSSSTHGTIHAASYMTSRAPHGLDDWISGIEHICVGDSLVACSTEFSGSVLVFSLGTGSLVYEIPGLYQPSKMCMTDFFLLTGGRGTWNQGGTHRRLNQLGQGHNQQHHFQGGFGHQGHPGQQQQHHPAFGAQIGGQQYGQDADILRHPQQQGLGAMEADEYMSCCINVWDLRTGDRLYSLIPRLPMRHLQQSKDISSILNNPSSRAQREQDQLRGKKQTIRTTSYSPMINMTEHAGRWTPTSHQQVTGPDSSRSSSTSTSFNTSRSAYVQQSPLSPQQPISAPLTLLDIAVTPDHSTLVVTLCERSGEGLEGVYCWDFGGSRLEGYHEEAPDVSTMIMDQNDLEYRTVANTVLADDHDDEDDFLDDDYFDSGEGGAGEDNDDDEDDDRYSNDRIHNNMVMQQVDSTVLRDMHQARVTGKLWIGWKLDERQFLRRKEGAMARTKAAALQKHTPNQQQQSTKQVVADSNISTSIGQLAL